MQSYFSKLPQFYYSNSQCVDITRRVKFFEDENNYPYIFYPYEIQNQLRSDTLSEYYYKDSELDWLIYLSNGIVDPYYGWYIDEDKMQQLMQQKYGSFELSLRKILFYTNNWATDDVELTPSFYNNNLPLSWRRYYDPVWGPGTRIMSYKRKQEDTIMNTNRIIEYPYGNSFVVGELVTFKNYLLNNVVGSGEVCYANSTVTRIQNLSDDFFVGLNQANVLITKTITGEVSNASIVCTNSSVIYENITIDEEKFWSPVYAYDYEKNKNEDKKNIRLVATELSNIIVDQFIKKLSEK